MNSIINLVIAMMLTCSILILVYYICEKIHRYILKKFLNRDKSILKCCKCDTIFKLHVYDKGKEPKYCPHCRSEEIVVYQHNKEDK